MFTTNDENNVINPYSIPPLDPGIGTKDAIVIVIIVRIIQVNTGTLPPTALKQKYVVIPRDIIFNKLNEIHFVISFLFFIVFFIFSLKSIIYLLRSFKTISLF